MAATRYQCTICKRERDILDNNRGVTLTTKCTITQGCRGSLIASKRLPGSTREEKAPPVSNLTDWEQRNVLHTHTQLIKSKQWRISHTINVPVAIDIVANGVEVAPTDYTLDTNGQNLITVTFAVASSGTAQLIARNGSKRRVYEEVDTTQLIQVSYDGRLILLDSTSELPAGTATLAMEVVTPDSQVYSGDQTITIDGLSRTPWTCRGALVNDITNHKTFNVALPNLFVVPTIGVIPDGSQILITQVQGRAPKRLELLVALCHLPTRTDAFNKRKDAVIDVFKLTRGLIYQRGELYAYESDIETLTPPLRVIE
jgi:hypothetical protein